MLHDRVISRYYSLQERAEEDGSNGWRDNH